MRTSPEPATTPPVRRWRRSWRSSAPHARSSNTQVDLLVTACEESGLLGAQAYARGRRSGSAGTLFLNFDTVGGDVPLTYIKAEGARPASRLAASRRHLEQIAAERPELGLRPAAGTPGLPTDATVMMARGEEAVTLLAQGESVPHYHQPTDTFEHIHPPTIERALEAGRELLTRLDRELPTRLASRRGLAPGAGLLGRARHAAPRRRRPRACAQLPSQRGLQGVPTGSRCGQSGPLVPNRNTRSGHSRFAKQE